MPTLLQSAVITIGCCLIGISIMLILFALGLRNGINEAVKNCDFVHTNNDNIRRGSKEEQER